MEKFPARVFLVIVYRTYTAHGPQTFMLQIRDEKTHEPLSGIVGDNIGPAGDHPINVRLNVSITRGSLEATRHLHAL
ncbi:hypothetical protein P3342_009564 [Pyrenophora teres f. teres]|nr:hypothetical protein P3342_009564 [Pyrenophora teres f. teres]